MKIFIISTEFPPGPGGIGNQAFHLARGLGVLGWEVAVLSPQDYASEEEIERFNSIQPLRLIRQLHQASTLLEGARRYGSLSRIAREFCPDILLASGGRAVWLTAVYGLLSRRPWAAIAHGGIEFGTPVGWERAISRWAYSQPDAVVCVSEYARERMRDLVVRPRRVEVITNGADEGSFRLLDPEISRALRREWGLEDAQIILTVGSLTERKGQEIVIRALPHVLEKLPGAHYVMAGLPQIGEKLGRLAQELGVGEHIHILGRLDQVTLAAAYNACDLFAMTSRHSPDGDSEGYGIAVIEAALCGKPAVVSGESGLAEAVVDGETGLLVPENDPQAAAQAILRILCEDGYSQRLGRQARARALGEQTWTSRVALYDRLLREILARH